MILGFGAARGALAMDPAPLPLSPASVLPLSLGGLFGAGAESNEDSAPVAPLAPAAAPRPEQPVIDPLAALAPYLPPAGEWRKIQGLQFENFGLTDQEADALNLRGTVGSNAVLSNQTGSAFDPEGFFWYFWGGGDDAYGGNEVYRLDLTIPLITQITQPAVLDFAAQDPAANGCLVPFDGPASASTYDGIVWSPATQSFFVFPSAGYCPGGVLNSQRIWEFDPLMGTWNAVADMSGLAGPVFAEYDAASGRIYLIVSGADAKLREFEPITGHLSAPISLGHSISAGSAVIDPRADKMVVFAQEGVFAISLASPGTITRLDDVPNGFNPGSGAAYDAQSGLIVLWDGGKDLRTFDAVAGGWTLQTPATGPAAGAGGVFSKWIAIEQLGVFAGYQNPAEGLWLYRLPAQVGTPAPANSPPVAFAGTNQIAVRTGRVVNLDGSGSFDPDGDSLSYAWTIVSSPAGAPGLSTPTQATASFTPLQDGAYVARLTVSDGSLSASATVTVTASNPPPVADAGPNQTIVLGQTVTIDASASSDPDGDTLSFDWSFTASPAGSAPVLSSAQAVAPSFVPDRVGLYSLSVNVSDGNATVSDSTEVTVVLAPPPNRAPVANAGPDQTLTEGQTATLNGSQSSDPDGDALTYSWALANRPAGSGASLSSATAAQPTLALDEPGDYVIRLAVSDGLLTSPIDEVTVTAEIDLGTAGGGSTGGGSIVDIPTQAEWVNHGAILTGGPSGSWDWQIGGAVAPCAAVKKDGIYYLYYIAGSFIGNNGDPRNRSLGVATSTDGLTFTKYSGNPIMTPAMYGEDFGPTGEAGIDSCAATVQANGIIQLHYGAMTEVSPDRVVIDIRLAESSNGLDFTDTGKVVAYNASNFWGSGDELGPLSTYVADDGKTYLFYLCLNGSGCRWDIGLASGPSLNSLPNSGPLMAETRDASAVVLGDTTGVLFATRNGSWKVEARTFPLSDPSQISAPVEVYDFNSILPQTHNSSIFPGIEFSHNTVLLDREAGKWFLYYHLGDPQVPDIAVMTASITTSTDPGSGSGGGSTGGGSTGGGSTGGDPVDITTGVDIGATSPGGYVWDALEVGRPVYTDRSFLYTGVPSPYRGLAVLRTANDDKSSSGNSFVTFNVSAPVTAYVAHDVRITNKPAWLSAWSATGDSLQTADTTLALYRKDFPAGPVVVGGNGGAGFSMYSVLLNVAGTPASTGGSTGGGSTGGGSTGGGSTGGGSTGGGSTGGGTVTGSSLSGLAASLAPGQWGELLTNNINPVLSAAGASDMILGYSEEIKWNPVTRQLQFVGGDHQDCTKFVVYNESTNSWVSHGKPSWVTCLTNHGYDHMAVDPNTGDFFSRIFRSSAVHRWDGSQWHALPNLNFGYTGAAAVGIEYFPEMGGLVWAAVESGTLGSVLLWERQTNSWKRLSQASYPMGSPHNFAEYNPVHKVVVFGGGNNSVAMYSLDAQGNITTLTPAPYGIGSGNASRFTVDPVSGDFLVFFDNGEFWVYDLPSDTWTKQNVSIPSSARTSRYGNPIFGVVTAPIPEYGVNVFVACDGADCHVTLYKHSQGTAGGGSTGGGSTGGGSTGGGSTGGGSTGGGSTGGTGSSAEFDALCADPNVLLCDPLDAGRASGVGVTASTPCATLPEVLAFNSPCGTRAWRFADMNDQFPPQYDTTMGSGSGSMKLTFGSQSDANDGGLLAVSFSADHSVQIGENETFFVRWKQRFSCEVIYLDCDPNSPSYKTDHRFYGTATNEGPTAFKTIIVNADTSVPNDDYVSSCTWQHLVINHASDHRIGGYHSCGWYEGWDRTTGERIVGSSQIDRQPGGDNSCMRILDSSGNREGWGNIDPNCVQFDSDQWFTFQMQITVGSWQPDRSGAPQTNVKFWVTDEAGQTVQIFDHNFYNRGPEPDTPWRKYGKVWLLNYMTGKDGSEVHPEGYTWYDELIVSRAYILN